MHDAQGRESKLDQTQGHFSKVFFEALRREGKRSIKIENGVLYLTQHLLELLYKTTHTLLCRVILSSNTSM